MNRTPNAPSVPPSYPSSSKKAKDWDKLEVEIKKEEKEEKLEGDAALNQYVFFYGYFLRKRLRMVSFPYRLFQQIYRDGTDEQKRAMNKSFVSFFLLYSFFFALTYSSILILL